MSAGALAVRAGCNGAVAWEGMGIVGYMGKGDDVGMRGGERRDPFGRGVGGALFGGMSAERVVGTFVAGWQDGVVARGFGFDLGWMFGVWGDCWQSGCGTGTTGVCVYDWANGRTCDVVWVIDFEMMMVGGVRDWYCSMPGTVADHDGSVSEKVTCSMCGQVCNCDDRIGGPRCAGMENGSVFSQAIWIWERKIFSRIGSVSVSVGDGLLSCLAGVYLDWSWCVVTPWRGAVLAEALRESCEDFGGLFAGGGEGRGVCHDLK